MSTNTVWLPYGMPNQRIKAKGKREFTEPVARKAPKPAHCTVKGCDLPLVTYTLCAKHCPAEDGYPKPKLPVCSGGQPKVKLGKAEYRIKRDGNHMLGSVPDGFDREDELKLFEQDPRFGPHAPRVMRLCLAQRSVKFTDKGTADGQDLDDAVANALDWLYEQKSQGKNPVKQTSGHSNSGDYVCSRVATHLAERERIEDPIGYQKVRQGDKRVWSNGGLTVEPVMPLSDDDEDNPHYSIDPDWDTVPDVYRPTSYRSPEIVLGYEDETIIDGRDKVIVSPYPESRGEFISRSHNQVLANAELSGNPKYADLRKVMESISLKIDEEPSIEIDVRTLREVGNELGMNYHTVQNRIKAYRELWVEVMGDALLCQPSTAELRKRRKGASGIWPAPTGHYRQDDVLQGVSCAHCRAAAKAGEKCSYHG